jgi:hypothetical protein
MMSSTDQPNTVEEHPAFTRAKDLANPQLRAHFPKNDEEASKWIPHVRFYALSSKVLVVSRTRIECAWRAYIDAVPGMNHADEYEEVLSHGDALPEHVARVLFPEYNGVPYAD